MGRRIPLFVIVTLTMIIAYMSIQLFVHHSPNSTNVMEKYSQAEQKREKWQNVFEVENKAKIETHTCVDLRSPLSDADDKFTRERKKRILKSEEICKNTSRVQYEMKRVEHIGYVVVDSKNEVLFVPVPKIGTTNWKKLFAHIALPKFQNLDHDEIMQKIPQDSARQELPLFSSYNPSEKKRMLKRYYKYIFVRDPFRRLLSGYRDRLEKSLPSRQGIQQKYVEQFSRQEKEFGDKLNSNMTKTVDGMTYSFRSFMKYLAVTDPSEYNPHWATYINVALPCAMKYDFIGRMETMEDDFNYISQCKLHEGRYEDFYPNLKQASSDIIYDKYFATVDDEDIVKVYQNLNGNLNIWAIRCHMLLLEQRVDSIYDRMALC